MFKRGSQITGILAFDFAVYSKGFSLHQGLRLQTTKTQIDARPIHHRARKGEPLGVTLLGQFGQVRSTGIGQIQ